jgi:superfamily II DNA or RNA helicase
MTTRTGAIRSAPGMQEGPTRRDASGSPPTAAPHLASSDVPSFVTATLRIEFQDSPTRDRYLLALASLLSSATEDLVAVDANGQLRDDLALHELAERLRAKRVRAVHARLPLGASGALLIAKLDDNAPGGAVLLELPLAENERGARPLWLQADPEHLEPLPLLALPIVDRAFTTDALHSLVALGARAGGFASAELSIDGSTDTRGNWLSKRSDGARPLRMLRNESVWAVGATDDDANAVAWFVAEPSEEKGSKISIEWHDRLKEILHQRAPVEVIEHHLRAASVSLPPLRVVDRQHAPTAHFMVPPEDTTISSLHPMPDAVVLAIDLQQPADALEAVLLHSVAHLALGHVRPGDAWGHWDTLKTASSTTLHRVWDQEARVLLSRIATAPTLRRVESLEECTPLEKAQLGLWRMIGEMLGERRRLHPSADRYQQAAYQRQAAQRLVSMLEDFGGAMLCDGVGLGKTYVATTMMVHYANAWRDQWAANPERLLEEPFRITILAPHSVVSTWRREALPGLIAFGVPLASVRVVSHAQLSRVVKASELLEPVRGGLSDLEHLLLSDLVIVDEAHNFRSLAARRTKVLRDLLRVQPRRDIRRRVVLLTATPINNSLDDLRQEVALLFSRPIWLSDHKTPDGYRRQAVKEIQDRCAKARVAKSRGDAAALVVHGQPDARFSDNIEFRDDLDFGPDVQRIGDYLKEQDKVLKDLQDRIRSAAQSGQPTAHQAHVRIAEDLLDRIVVQRSRGLCKEIERQQSSTVELLFRPDAGAPEKLRYSDEYDGIEDALAGFLPLFSTNEENGKRRALSFKIHMWYDVREGLKTADDTSSVVGLQRVLVLKRLESSPVSFLITLLRLAVVHAHRLQQLNNLCLTVGDKARSKELQASIEKLIARQDAKGLAKIRSLTTGERSADSRRDFIESLSAAYTASRPVADPDDPPPQLTLFEAESENPRLEELDRLWSLSEPVLADFETLLEVTPGLADIVFGRFERSEWPRRFIAGGEAIDWPVSPTWGQRLVSDAKIRQLVARVLTARRAGQKVVVFSQFSDTVAYIQSVLRACRNFSRTDWQIVVRGLGISDLRSDEVTGLLDVTQTITGATADRDEVVNSFAPYYRIGPVRPAFGEGDAERRLLDDAWEASWTGAILRPVDVLLSTDVLAEGVNLQDAALLINYDVHWNPVRMIQRAGRIDRRLNPRIEHGRDFADLEALAARVGRPVPRYYWHAHPSEPPVAVNMILPDELEQELLLRERIATKTLAIDFTLGLEQGTGAEADWMASYKYQGITSLNSFQRDRAIEQVGGHHERLSKALTTMGVRAEWAENLNGWFRARSATDVSPLVSRAMVGRRGGSSSGSLAIWSPLRKMESSTGSGRRSARANRCSTVGSFSTADPRTFLPILGATSRSTTTLRQRSVPYISSAQQSSSPPDRTSTSYRPEKSGGR